MRDLPTLCFDGLEDRKLLSTVPAAVVHVSTPATPIVLTGTLNVNLSGATSTVNSDSSQTSSVPVVGRLGSLGRVTGFWNQSIDGFGNYLGPDTLVLKSSLIKGSLTIAFNNQNTGLTAKVVGKNVSDYQHAQKLVSGTGGFAHVSEHGSIELMLNTNQDTYKSLVLISVTP